jgi:hypothetical protein
MLDDRGVSQAGLAHTAGFAKAAVGDSAAGKGPFTVKQLHAVASAFG